MVPNKKVNFIAYNFYDDQNFKFLEVKTSETKKSIDFLLLTQSLAHF